MPSKSKKQARFMAAVAHSRKFAKKAGVPQSVGKEFNRADKRKRKAKDQAMGKFAADEIKHDPHSGKFTSGGGGITAAGGKGIGKLQEGGHTSGVPVAHHSNQSKLHADLAQTASTVRNVPVIKKDGTQDHTPGGKPVVTSHAGLHSDASDAHGRAAYHSTLADKHAQAGNDKGAKSHSLKANWWAKEAKTRSAKAHAATT